MAEPCEHEWRWLPRIEYVLTSLGQQMNAWNVDCAKCGTKGWAHGAMPPPKPLYERNTPATGRN